MSMSLGRQLKRLRKLKGWTQTEASERSGIDIRNLSRYETDSVTPRRGTLEKLAEVYDVAIEELLEVAVEKEPLISDPELLEQFQQISQLAEEDRSALKRIINAVIVKSRVHSLTG